MVFALPRAGSVLPGTDTAPAREVLLFDPNAHPQSWNERMADGEFALLYDGAIVQSAGSGSDVNGTAPFCSIFTSRPAAEQYAARQIELYPTLRCKLYDHHGLGGQPLFVLRGAAHRAESEITPLLRRWVGGVLFVVGSVLTLIDWHADFRYLWPSMLGTRMLVPGATVLALEAALQLSAAWKKRRQAVAA